MTSADVWELSRRIRAAAAEVKPWAIDHEADCKGRIILDRRNEPFVPPSWNCDFCGDIIAWLDRDGKPVRQVHV